MATRRRRPSRTVRPPRMLGARGGHAEASDPSSSSPVMVLATALFSEAALRFVLLGVATGSLTALVALGIVLVHRTSGVLNFSAGAMGGIAAFVFYDLRDGGMPTALAVTIGLL